MVVFLVTAWGWVMISFATDVTLLLLMVKLGVMITGVGPFMSVAATVEVNFFPMVLRSRTSLVVFDPR